MVLWGVDRFRTINDSIGRKVGDEVLRELAQRFKAGWPGHVTVAHIPVDQFAGVLSGYSSLGYLAKLPLNALKIDRSFVATMGDSPESMTIVSTIISLAQSLGLKVIAEGVEEEGQSRFLRLFKCNELQGYLISRPLPAGQIADFVRGRSDRRLRARTLDLSVGEPGRQPV